MVNSKLFNKLAIGLAISLFGALTQAQTAPVLSLTSPIDIGPSPQTSTLYGLSSTVFNGTLYVAFQSHGGNYLWISTSTDGITYTDPGTSYKSILMNFAPSITTFNGKLYVAYTNQSGGVSVISSSDGVNFSLPVSAYVPTGIGTSVAATSAPTLVAYNGNLYVYWESDLTTSGANDNIIQSSELMGDGSWLSGSGVCQVGWNTSLPIRPKSNSEVGAAVLNGELYIATQLGSGADGSNELLVCSSNKRNTLYPSIYPGSGISATVYNGSLYLAFKYNHSGNYLEITGTEDGVNFTTPVTSYSNVQINGNNEIAPAITAFNGSLYVFYTGNSSDHYIYSVHSY